MSLWKRFIRVFYSDMTVLTWMLGWIAQSLAFGFFVSGTNTGNYDLLNTTLPKETWGMFFTVYGGVLILSCLYYIEKWILALCAIAGVWLWSYLFFSFAIFDKSPIASTEWMLLLPIVAQMWIFFSVANGKKSKAGVVSASVEEHALNNLLRNVRHELNSLNSDLSLLGKENEYLKSEVSNLTHEVTRIKSSLCFVEYCSKRHDLNNDMGVVMHHYKPANTHN